MIDVFLKGSEACFRVRVQPRSSQNRVAGLLGSSLKVQLTSPPLDGRANKQLVEFLSDALGIPQRSIRLVAGQRSREKTVGVRGFSTEDLLSLLETLLS